MSRGAESCFSFSPKLSIAYVAIISCKNGVSPMGEAAYDILRRILFAAITVGLIMYIMQALSRTDELPKVVPAYSVGNNYGTIYDWPNGCSKDYYQSLDTQHWNFHVEIPKSCASPKYYVDRGDRLGVGFDHGRAEVTHYFRIADDIANIMCYKAILGSEKCDLSDVKKGFFLIKNKPIRNFRCRIPSQEREILTGNQNYPGATCVSI